MYVDILKWDENNLVGIIRTNRQDVSRLWSALTLYQVTIESGNGQNCDMRFDILGNSGYLVGLISDSRDWKRNILNT